MKLSHLPPCSQTHGVARKFPARTGWKCDFDGPDPGAGPHFTGAFVGRAVFGDREDGAKLVGGGLDPGGGITAFKRELPLRDSVRIVTFSGRSFADIGPALA